MNSGKFSPSKSMFSSEKKNTGKTTGNGGGILEDIDDACTLSWKQRLIGFSICAVIGVAIAFAGYIRLIVLPQPRIFAILFTLGNITALCSTAFLIGPMKQFKKMFESGRIIATIIYLVSMGLTLFFGIKKKFVLCIIFMIIQIFAFIWYCLSYIPFIRSGILRLLGLNDLIPK